MQPKMFTFDDDGDDNIDEVLRLITTCKQNPTANLYECVCDWVYDCRYIILADSDQDADTLADREMNHNPNSDEIEYTITRLDIG